MLFFLAFKIIPLSKFFQMHKIYLICLLTFFALQLNAQDQTAKHGIGVHFAGFDFYGPQTGDYLTSDKTLADGKKKSTLLWDPALRVSYWYAVSKRLDINASLFGSALQYPTSDKDSLFIKAKSKASSLKAAFPMVSFDLKGNYNIFPKDKFLLSPFVGAGISTSLQESNLTFDIPVGLGLNVKLANNIYGNLASDYHLAVGSGSQNHFVHSLGIVYWFNGMKKNHAPREKPVAAPIVKDMDNDGIPDSEDSCPSLAGTKEMKGCPDRDKDGVADRDDLCPEQAGSKSLNGCPDKDGDGIADKSDKCPEVAGISKYQGCPVPDSDNDGFNDEIDQCPTVASSTNRGCPEIKQEVIEKVEKAAKGINFETGSATILKKSFTDLDKIVAILKNETTLRVDIAGHTDNKGKTESNLILSQKRADACKKYLEEHGIEASRISSTGYGDSKPIASNDTAEGRSKNRRTEFVLKN